MKKTFVILFVVVAGILLISNHAISYDLRGWWTLESDIYIYHDDFGLIDVILDQPGRAHFYRSGDRLRCPFWWYEYDDGNNEYLLYDNTTSDPGPGDMGTFIFETYPYGLEAIANPNNTVSFFSVVGEDTLMSEVHEQYTGYMGEGGWMPIGTSDELWWNSPYYVEPYSHISLVIISSGTADEPLPVVLDIKPQDFPNYLNPNKKGVLPVAILGTESFDVRRIDAPELELNGVKPIRFSYEAGADGYGNLYLKFKAQDIIATIGTLTEGHEEVLNIKGYLVGGTWLPDDGARILGSDSVVITTEED